MTTDNLPRAVPRSIMRARRVALGLLVLAVLIVIAGIILYVRWSTTRVPTVI